MSNVPVITVYDVLTDPQTGAPLVNWPVRIRLNYSGATSVSPVTAVANREITVTTDSTGTWAVTLVANDNLNPSGSYYVVQPDTMPAYLINVVTPGVPAGGWQSSAIIVNAPVGVGVAGFQLPGGTNVNGVFSATAAEFNGQPWIDASHPAYGLAPGNTAAQNDTALAAWIAALTNGSTGFIEAGTYHISQPIRFLNKSGIRVFAGGAVGEALSGGVTFLWDGANSGVAFKVYWCRDSVFEDITVNAGTGTLAVCFDIDKPTGIGGTVTSTFNTFRRCAAFNGATAGFRLSAVATSNNDNMFFERCWAESCGSGIQFLNAQSKQNTILACQFSLNGVSIDVPSGGGGSYHSYSCGFNASTTADFRIQTGSTDYISVNGAHSENSRRAVYAPSGFIGTGMSFVGCRFDPGSGGGAAADYCYIRCSGPWMFKNVDFASGSNHASCTFDFSDASNGILSFENCQFPGVGFPSIGKALSFTAIGCWYVGPSASAPYPAYVNFPIGANDANWVPLPMTMGSVLDLSETANGTANGGIAPVNGSSSVGDKVSLSQSADGSGFGFGIQTGALATYLPGVAVGANKWSFRAAASGATTQKSSGTELAAIQNDGGIVPGALHAGGTAASSRIYSGTGAPSDTYGANGDFYFRSDTPATPTQRLYIKSAGAWVATAL